MRGLLNPLLVHPSARPLVRPVRAPSVLIRPSASNLRAVCLSAHPPLLCPTSACPPVRLPSARPPQFARPPPIRPSAAVRPSAPSSSSKNYLLVSSCPKFFTSCMPREIATSAIRGASRSHSGIRVSKLPPLCGQP